MHDVFRFALLGVGSGSLYALTALGIVLIHRGSGTVNFAQGAFGLIASVVYWELNVEHGLPVWLAIVAGLGASSLAGLLTHALIMRPLRNAPGLTRLIATLAVLIVVAAAVDLHVGTELINIESFLPTKPVSIFGADIGRNRLVFFGVAAVLSVMLWAMSRYTMLGRKTSAVAENRRAAARLGFSPDRVAAVNWAIGGAVAGIVGVCLTPLVGLSATQATSLLIPAMAAALAGNLRSFPITFAAGVMIGMLQSLMSRYQGIPGLDWKIPGLVDSIPFVVILVILLTRGSRFPPKTAVREQLQVVGSGHVPVRTVTVLSAAVLVLAWFVVGDKWVGTFTLTFGTATLLLSFVVVTGYAGQLTLAQLALAGFATWSSSRLAEEFDIPFVLIPPIAVACTVPLGVAVGFPAIRARGANLALATLGFAVALDSVVFRNPALTGRGLGIPIDPPSLFGWPIDAVTNVRRYMTVAMALFLLAVLAVANVRRGRVGRRLLAVRSNERAAAAMGVDVTGVKLYAFGLAAALAALSGVILGYRGNYANLDGFGAIGSITSIVNAAVGSVGYLAGPLVGSQLVPGTVGPELLRNAIHSVDTWLPLIGGVLLILTLFEAPDGLAKMNADQFRHVADKVRGRSAVLARRRDAVSLPDAIHVTPMATRRLVADGVTVRYGGVVAVRSLSLTVEPGQVHGLIGPNGAGKTSVIDAMTGFTPMAAGSVTVGDRDVTAASPASRARAGLVRSFQSLELFEDLSVLDNLRAASDSRDLRSYVSDLVRPINPPLPDVVVSVIGTFGLEPVLHSVPKDLSYGTRRLVAIARAVASSPSVLLLDEPAAGLDATERRELATLMRRLAAEWQIGILLVEHDVELVRTTCDLITVIDFGSMIAHGRPAEIVEDPDVRRAYLGAVEPDGGGTERGVTGAQAQGPVVTGVTE